MFRASIREKTDLLFGPERGGEVAEALYAMAEKYRALNLGGRMPDLSEKDAMLIVYPGQFTGEDKTPLSYLNDFAAGYLGADIPCIHILPFYPYTADDGFSISDYRAVKPDHGSWEDIERLAGGWRLMYDFVANHVSVSHPWFQGYLGGDPEYANYFIEADPDDPRLTLVRRPRTHPLLTPFETSRGIRHLWTTFSSDQIDLNLAEPKVFLEIVDTMLHYIARGAHFIRLDAVNYTWKKLGTDCIHLPETHAAIKVLRAMADEVAPGTVIIAENNVPHAAPGAFCAVRQWRGDKPILSCASVSPEPVKLSFTADVLGGCYATAVDIAGSRRFVMAGGRLEFSLESYEVAWLRLE